MSRPTLQPVERPPAAPPEPEKPDHRTDGAGNRIELDSQRRYILPHPETGDNAKWIRVTRFITAIDDTEALRKWELRSLMRACAAQPSALTRLRPASGGPKWAVSRDDDDLVDDLLTGARSSADDGTRLHRVLEDFDRDGTEPENEADRAYVLAYSGELRRAGFSPCPDLIERVVVSTEYPVGRHHGIAGTVDRWLMATQTVRMPDGGAVNPGGMVIADIKTGQRPPDDKYVAAKYCRQLSAYASARWMFDGDDTYIDTPAVPDWGLVIHAPAAADPPECSLWWMDLDEGRTDLLLCQATLDRRRNTGTAHKIEKSLGP